jgi:hypothetical protein
VNTPVVPLDDGFACTIETCDPATGNTVVTAVDAACTDGDVCTGVERCDPAAAGAAADGCVAGAPPVVDDGNLCTIDSCDAIDGVRHEPVDVDDGVACTVDSCDGATGTITNSPDNSLCPLNGVCDPLGGCGQFDALILTEVRFVGTSDDVFEVQNIGPRAIDLTRLTVQIGAATFNLTTRTANLAAGERTTLSSTGTATFGLTGAADLADSGGRVALLLDGTEVDVVDFASVVTSGALTASDFVGSAALSTQLDVGRATAAENDSPLSWCLSFRAADTFGAANQSCRTAVINEVLYDAPGADDGQTFIELAGPGGAVIGGLVVRGVSANGNLQAGTFKSSTLPPDTRLDAAGLLLLADEAGTTGTTAVAGAALLFRDLDPDNDNASVELLDGTTRIDVVGYGTPAAAAVEGAAVADIVPLTGGPALSLARREGSQDTNDNGVDFFLDPTPTPGAPNGALAVSIVGVSPDEVPANAASAVAIDVADGAIFAGVAGTPLVAVDGRSACPVEGGGVFISEVADTLTANARYVELFNAGPVAVNLTGFAIRRYSNGGTAPTNLALTGSIPSCGTFTVISTVTFNTVYPGLTTQQTNNGINGNGDDVYELVNGATVLDVFGEVGVDGTGQAWEYEDSIAMRKPHIVRGSPILDITQWTIARDPGGAGDPTRHALSPCAFASQQAGVTRFLCTVQRRDGGGGLPRVIPEGGFVAVAFANPPAVGGADIEDPAIVIVDGSNNETDVPTEADFCNIQFPPALAGTVGVPTAPVFSQIFEAGVTEAPGPSPNVLVQFGLSRTDTPTSLADFVFVDGPTHNSQAQAGNNDEYSFAPTPTAAGTFRYLFRYSLDGGLNWTHCDLDGAGSNPGLSFDIAQTGVLTVTP